MNIDKETYAISKKNYYKQVYKKSQIILGGSLRKENFHIKRLQKKEYGLSKKWNTYTINRNGEIFEHYNPIYYSDYMGIKDIDKKSISIVLENMGMVFYDYLSSNYVNNLYEICDESIIYEKSWKNGRYWEKYTEKQFDSCLELCGFLCDKFSIEKDSFGYNVYESNAIHFKGVLCRSNYDIDYNDLNPSFNLKYFMDELSK